MKVIYRISDSSNVKTKPLYLTKTDTFLHFLKIFINEDIYVIADNVCDETYIFLLQHVNYDKVLRTNLGNTASFMYSANFAINTFDNDEEIIYFAEDDYIYTKDAPKIIAEGLNIADYSSGYDHPDKYINHNEGGPNPFISEGGESTRVLISNSSHWKITNSCCMTFAVKIKTIKQDINVYGKYCGGRNPYDFQMFCELRNTRKIVSCIPSVSTHGEIEYLAKFIDWDKEFHQVL